MAACSSIAARGDLDQARSELSKALELSSEHVVAKSELGLALLLGGKPSEALDVYEQLGSDTSKLAGRALALHDLGRGTESRRALEALLDHHSDDVPYQIAQVYSWHGERDHAFEWLERAYAARDPAARNVKVDPLLRGLHADARYGALLRKMNLPAD